MILITGTPPSGTVGVAYSFAPTVDADVNVGTGTVIATPDQTVKVPSLAPSNAVGAGIPLGAQAWPRALDPADICPYAIDFSALLGGDEIGDVLTITMSAAGAAVGVQICDQAPRLPIVGQDGKTVQVWFQVASLSQLLTAFDGSGLQVAVTFLVKSDADPFQQFERSAVLTVRQM